MAGTVAAAGLAVNIGPVFARPALRWNPLGRLAGWAGLVLLAPACLAVSSLAMPWQQRADQMHERAVQQFREGRFAEAYGRFAMLADSGHPASARYALFMLDNGPALFGRELKGSSTQRATWQRTALALPVVGAAADTEDGD
jgi:hypothetical protein